MVAEGRNVIHTERIYSRVTDYEMAARSEAPEGSWLHWERLVEDPCWAIGWLVQ